MMEHNRFWFFADGCEHGRSLNVGVDKELMVQLSNGMYEEPVFLCGKRIKDRIFLENQMHNQLYGLVPEEYLDSAIKMVVNYIIDCLDEAL